ncbi:uncharacterized protein LOC141849312 [Brevipalpus obovatus]|uniref:uncharacterized protein LOC141849312 n=1 Tax=Brevipalpus obovatus TaxID=246614 RepID=UPI003D9F21D5
MNPSCVSVLIFSLLVTSTLGARQLDTEKNPGCAAGECETLDIMYSTSVESQDQLIFMSSTDGTHMGALVTESGNITIDYKQILKAKCDGVFTYQEPKPKNSIGMIFESFPISTEEPKWDKSKYTCKDDNCVIEFGGAGKEKEAIDIQAQITADSHAYPEFPDNKLSPKTLHIQIQVIGISTDVLKTKGIKMYIVESTTENYSSVSSDKIGLVTFGSTDDDTEHPFKMIESSAEFIVWKPEATRTDKTTISVNTTDPEKVTVDLTKYNLPVACFFGDQKDSKVYEITATFDVGEIPTPTTMDLLWSVSIGLGEPRSHGTTATSHALRNWSIVGIIVLLVAILGGVLYSKRKRRGYNSSV